MQASEEFAYLERVVLTQKNLLPTGGNPFYIVAPPYARISAGVKVLYALCHYLNMLGEDAYMIPFPVDTVPDKAWPYYCRFLPTDWNNRRLAAKILTKEIADRHFREGRTPVCIFPEVYDNFLGAPFSVRYMLNYPGLLAPKHKVPQDYTISYSKRLADFTGTADVLHVPAVDMEFFYFRDDRPRAGACFYAGKYKDIYHGDLGALPKDCVEILRSGRMSTEEVREIFWTTEYFYCYEDTALAIEAALCGCTVVFVPNEHYKDGTISSHELGMAGMAWGTDPAEIARAKASVRQMEPILAELYRRLPGAIAEFAAKAKVMAAGVPYRTPIMLPYEVREVFVTRDAPGAGPVASPENPAQRQMAQMMPAASVVSGAAGAPAPVVAEMPPPPAPPAVTPIQAVKRIVKAVLKEWILPPGIKRIAGKILRDILGRIRR